MYDFLSEGQPQVQQRQQLDGAWRKPAPLFSPGVTAALGAVGLVAGGVPGALGAVLVTQVGNFIGQETGTSLWDDLKSDLWRKPLTIGGVAGLAVGGAVGYALAKR